MSVGVHLISVCGLCMGGVIGIVMSAAGKRIGGD